ncbi:MAG: M1 family peptidase, partial [Acidobacteria bacterium]|nr:M1 family peptidase [Acidobacteriota bacterium]
QTRLVDTDDFLKIAEKDSGMKLDWFFELYLRQPKLPKLIAKTVTDCGSNCTLGLEWETPNGMPFPMPIDVEVNGKMQRLEMKDGKASLAYTGALPAVDPKGWVLKLQ